MLTDAVDRAVAAVLRDPRSVPGAAPSTGSAPAGQAAHAGGQAGGRENPAAGETRGGVPEATARVAPSWAEGWGVVDDPVGAALSRAARWPGILVDPDAAGRPGPAPRDQLIPDPSIAPRSPRPAETSASANRGGTFQRFPREPRPPDHDHAPPGPLAGIPVAVKDNIDVAGRLTGMGGPTGRHRADRDAAVVRLLRAAGATVVGHAAMRELAWGVTTPGCPNPWRDGWDTGGSSGGSAAAVAAGIVPLALGTDTGGSIRIPAALCGVTGLRPTHGSAPMAGITAMTPDLDTVGPLGLRAADCLLVHEALAGPGDPAPDSVRGQVVGVLTGWQGRVDPATAAAVDDAAHALADAGARLAPVDLGSAGLATAVAYVLMLIASARLHLADARRHAGAVDAEVFEQLEQGARIDADPDLFPRAVTLAAAIRRQVRGTLADRHLAAVLGPVTAVPGVPSGATTVPVGERILPVADALSRYTALASVTGLPALTLPAGLNDGLPVGVQLLGPARGERTLALLAGPIERGPGAAVADARRQMRHVHGAD